MNSRALLRTGLLVAALGATVAAQAVTINLVSTGTFTFDGFTFAADEDVLFQNGGYGPLDSLSLVAVNSDFPVVGSGVYSGAGGELYFDFAYEFGSGVGIPAQSLVGSWTATGGTGTYALATGTGTLATSLLYSTGESDTSFVGEIEAVPEPASLAALGVGAFALLRRRKKA